MERRHTGPGSQTDLCASLGPLPGDEDANIHLDEREGEREAPQEGRQELKGHPPCPVPSGRLTSTVLCKPHNNPEKKALLFYPVLSGRKEGLRSVKVPAQGYITVGRKSQDLKRTLRTDSNPPTIPFYLLTWLPTLDAERPRDCLPVGHNILGVP